MLPRPSPEVVYCPVDSGAVLLHAGQEIYFGLNEVGAFIWQQLPPVSETIEQLVAAMSAKYPDVDASVLRADLLELLETLRQNGLLLAADA